MKYLTIDMATEYGFNYSTRFNIFQQIVHKRSIDYSIHELKWRNVIDKFSSVIN